jgi:glycosyltransferase involved in cell wall biosynthesis
MKLVIISPYQFRLHRGIERFVYSLSNRLSQDFNVRIVIYVWNAPILVDWGYWHPNIIIRRVPGSRYFQELLAAIFYRFWIIRDKPDCTILNFLFHGEDVLPKNIPYLYVLNYPASQVPRRYEFIKKMSKKFSNLEFVAVSEMVKKEAQPYLANKKISVILNGVDTGRFKAERAYLKGRTLKLLTLAALEERKGIQFVVKAVKLLKDLDITYDIYGDGPYREKLDRLIKDLRLSNIIKIHPPVSNPEDILKNADIFCLLSKGEALPLAVLEAMSSGLAVVVSQYPPFDEIITKETGMVVERENDIAVAAAISSLKNIDKRKELGRKAQKRAQEYFSWENVTKKYNDILCSVVNRINL